jgi:hypothetical protein
MNLDSGTMVWLLSQVSPDGVAIRCNDDAEWVISYRGEEDVIIDDSLEMALATACIHQMRYGNAQPQA